MKLEDKYCGVKPVRLTQKELDRADSYDGFNKGTGLYTIIRRLQADGKYMVAVVKVGSGMIESHEVAETREGVPAAIRSLNRWADKCAEGGRMSWKSRRRIGRKNAWKGVR